MIAVELKYSERGKYWYYVPVCHFDNWALAEVTGGYLWFVASAWDRIAKALKERYNIKLTKKWVHVQRQRALNF